MTPRRADGDFLLTAVVSACASQSRRRNARLGPGSIPGIMLVCSSPAGAKIYHKTLLRTVKVKCSGPLQAALTNPSSLRRSERFRNQNLILSAAGIGRSCFCPNRARRRLG